MYDFQQFEGEMIGGDMCDILVKHNITNCADFYDLAAVLTDDYNLRRVNIIPLIKDGMNARLLMYLRICYIVKPIEKDKTYDDKYYRDIRELGTIEEIVEYRKRWYAVRDLQFSNYDYENYWLLYLSLKPKQRRGMQFDFEYLYEDCDYNHKIASEIENQAGYVYFRNEHNAVIDEMYRGLVHRLERDKEDFERIMSKRARFLPTPKLTFINGEDK